MSEREDPQRVVKRRFKRPCPVDLTDAECTKMGKKAGKLQKKLTVDETALKERHRAEREALKAKHAEVLSLLDNLERGQQDVDVECVEVYDFRNDRVEEVRTDTEEVVSSRKMEPGERQEEIGAEKKGKKGEKAEKDKN